MKTPIAAPGRWFAAHREEVQDAITAVIESGQYILGPRVDAFEAELARYCNTPHAVAVGSGTDALTLTLMALGVAGGDVITSAHTATATIAAIEMAGAAPVLADIDPSSHCLSPDSVASRLSSRTRAVVAVHMFGQPADMDSLQSVLNDTGIHLVEDCAQAHGATINGCPVGSIGVAGAFSFYPTKNIGALGDAGAVVTADAALAQRIRQLRQYGWDKNRISTVSGRNSRMDEIQAAILALRMKYFDASLARRRQIAIRYTAAAREQGSIATPGEIEGTRHAYHLYVVEHERRDDLAQHMAARGIQTARHYETPVYSQPAYQDRCRISDMPGVERLYQRMLSIPLYPELTDQEVDTICMAMAEFKGRGSG